MSTAQNLPSCTSNTAKRARNEVVQSVAKRRRVGRTTSETDPLTFSDAISQDPNLRFPEFLVVVATGEEGPSDEDLVMLRENSEAVLTTNGDIPKLGETSDPFYHGMKMTIADFQDVIDERTFDAMGDVDRNLPTVGASGLFGRGASQEVRHEDVAKRCAGKCPWFWAHAIKPGVYNRLLRKDDVPASALTESWTTKFDQDSRNYQHYLLKTMTVGTEGLVALYGFDLFSRFSEDQIKNLVGKIFDANPLAHAMAMFAKLADTVDFLGIYRDAAHDENEHARRLAWRASIRFLPDVTTT